MAPVSFTVVAKAGCGGYLLGSSHTGTIHLKNGMAQDKVISVTLLIASPSPLVLNQPPAPLSYIKGSGIPGYTDVYVTAGPGMYFTVDTSSLPVWLTVDATAGTSFRDLRFSSTVMAESMPPGSYSATVRLQVSGYGDLEVILTMQVSNPAATLTVVEGPTRNYTWSIGQPAWTPFVTLKSSGSPIPYSIQSGGALAPMVDPKLINGLAYNFGTTIPVTFASSALAGVPVGGVLSGTLSIISGNPASTYVVTFTITVQAPGATLSGISPTTVPTSVAGSAIQVVLIGTGFVSSLDPSLKTKVGVVIGNTVTMNTNFATTVLNPSNLLLTITVPSTPDPLLPFALGGTVILGICNPIRGACSVPTGVVTLNIGASPLIQAVTSASTYVQAVTYPPAAPYDMLAIFGTNLCATCVGPNAIMNGAPLPPTLGYPTSLSNTDAQNITRTLKVTFKQHAATTAPTVTLAGPAITQTDAPLLFATNTQINLLVPQAVKDAVGQGNQLVDLVVTYGNAGNVATSAPYTLIAVPSNPGVFTINSDGRGDAAVLDSNYLVVGPGNPGAMRDSTVAPSDTVMIYMTGLGLPSAGADNANAGGGAYPADCISTDSYLTALSGLTGVNLTAVDGLIIQSTLVNTKRLVPCLSAALKPQVRIGGVICPVSYAGWVPDSIAGLYQVNVTLPGTTGTFYPDWPALTNPITDITGWTVLPVEVKSYDNVLSQTGVTIVVAPR